MVSVISEKKSHQKCLFFPVLSLSFSPAVTAHTSVLELYGVCGAHHVNENVDIWGAEIL